MKNKLIFLTTLISVISLTACSFIRKHKIDSSDVTSASSSIDSEHEHIPGSPVTEGRVEPTCTEDGYYYSVVYCTECHKELSRERMTLEHLGHDIHIGEAHTPTCEEAGWEEYEYCSRCDYSTKVVIGPVDHDYVLDPKTKQITKRLTKDDGLVGNIIFKISSVRNGEIWICTGSGISIFSKDKLD